MKLDLVREPVGALGGMGGRGAKKVLGAPKASVLETVVREAVQNSWDAREKRNGPVQFGVEAYSLTRGQREALAEALGDGPKQEPRVPDLPKMSEPLDAIAIFDRGTKGLGGEPRPDAADGKDGDFARFVFSIGETKPDDGEVAAGGTYGFGRSAFLDASELSTILVHSVCATRKGGLESRFIAMNWRKSYRLPRDGRRYAGRHWWGRADRDGVLPLTGTAADKLAESLGMPLPGKGEKGTTIVILQPRWTMSASDEQDADEDVESLRKEARRRVSQALLWYVWPRLIDKTLDLSVRWFGTNTRVPHPDLHPRLSLFARALEIAQKERKPSRFENYTVIESLRPIQELGAMGLAKRVHRGPADDDHLDPAEPMHHVALMRKTRLVVQYLRCPPAPERWEYAGVFVTDDKVDRVFADSEPPTHDYWSKERLVERSHKVFVNVALKKIQSDAREFATPGSLAPDGTATGLGPISDELGGLLIETDGPSTGKAGRGGRGGRGGEGGKKGKKLPLGVRIELGPASREEKDESSQLLRIPFTVTGGARDATVAARAAVVVDGGGSEEEAPAGTRTPEIIGWELSGVRKLRPGAQLPVPAEETLQGHLVVEQPADCTLRIAIDPVR